MKAFDVEVFVGENSVRQYLVRAETEAEAVNIAAERVRDLVGCSIIEAEAGMGEDEDNYDEVLP